MNKRIGELAYHGNWAELLPVQDENRQFVNSATETKGYTPLHQAAWHGAPAQVIGQVLALGANPTLRTASKNQTPREIAAEMHEDRADLQFLLSDSGRTLGQLIRKAASERPEMFSAYDGNQVLCDRFIEHFNYDLFGQSLGNVEERLAVAFKALTGCDMYSGQELACVPVEGFDMQVTPSFWTDRFVPLLLECASRSHVIPIEKRWAVVSDLFDPPPVTWGLRGDVFLWMEMRQNLCHVPVPGGSEELGRLISSAFTALTGHALDSKAQFQVPRSDRGGMSGGMVSAEFWADVLIPMLQQRAFWLQQSWQENH